MFGDERACRMDRAAELARLLLGGGVACVVDQGRLHALRGRHGKGARYYARGHAGQQAAQRAETARLWVSKGSLDAVETHEPDGVLGDGAGHQRGAAKIERARPLRFDDVRDDEKGVARSRDVGRGFELNARLGEFKGVREEGLYSPCGAAGYEGEKGGDTGVRRARRGHCEYRSRAGHRQAEDGG